MIVFYASATIALNHMNEPLIHYSIEINWVNDFSLPENASTIDTFKTNKQLCGHFLDTCNFFSYFVNNIHFLLNS